MIYTSVVARVSTPNELHLTHLTESTVQQVGLNFFFFFFFCSGAHGVTRASDSPLLFCVL